MKLSPRATALAAFHRIVALVKPLLRSKSEYSILDPVARRQALGKGVATPRLLRALSVVVSQARHGARQVTAPTLVIHSRRDLRIAVRDGRGPMRHSVPPRNSWNGSNTADMSSPSTMTGRR